MIIDSGCDQSIISISSFVIGCRTGIKYSVDGALDDMKSSAPLEVVNRCVTCCTITTTKKKILLELNQCLLDLSANQSESLLQPHQARAHGVIVNDVAKRHLATDKRQGAQNLVVDDVEIPLNFDGWKCYFTVSKPTTEQLKLLPKFTLTSELPYLPQKYIVARN